MGKPKYTPVMMELEQEKLEKIQQDLSNSINTSVCYSEDYLAMANDTIKKLREEIAEISRNLYNLMNPHDIDDGSSGLE